MTRTIKFDGSIPCNVSSGDNSSHMQSFARHGDRDAHDQNFNVVSADHINAIETRNYFKARSYLKELDAFADATAWLKDC
tara:strand:+ start:126 stop:365 length:240 start_codon:yes stop_codon:yes gene_type:complete